MNRSMYDQDVSTFSPNGRLHQVEYAMEAVKQGSAIVGLRSSTHVVLGALKRAPSELGAYQQKVFQLDEHMGMAFSGLNADGRVLCRYLRNECINHKFTYDTPFPVGRLMRQLADRSQMGTQRYSKRPYGVGLLVAGYDSTGPRLFQTCPSANLYEYYAIAIGSRSQASKTYLEKNFESFKTASVDDLYLHALRAVRAASPDKEAELTTLNCALGVVGPNMPFRLIEGDDLKTFLAILEAEKPAAPPPEEGLDAAQPME